MHRADDGGGGDDDDGEVEVEWNRRNDGSEDVNDDDAVVKIKYHCHKHLPL